MALVTDLYEEKSLENIEFDDDREIMFNTWNKPNCFTFESMPEVYLVERILVRNPA